MWVPEAKPQVVAAGWVGCGRPSEGRWEAAWWPFGGAPRCGYGGGGLRRSDWLWWPSRVRACARAVGSWWWLGLVMGWAGLMRDERHVSWA